jgi:Caspase domain
MTLVVDRRDMLGKQPGLHALVVGISNYPHLPGGDWQTAPESFGLAQLTMAARTAHLIYRWLAESYNNPVAPLATCRLLLSPSPTEIEKEPELADLTLPPTLDNFLRAAAEWRRDASSDARDVSLLYLVGHSFERGSADQILLLEDFGNSIGATLRNSVSISSIFNGMLPSSTRDQIARTQLYFVDTARSRPPRRLEELGWTSTLVFDAELSGIDDRNAPIFYATAPGRLAYGFPADQTLFSKALMRCLNGAAGRLQPPDKWCVTTISLIDALPTVTQDLIQSGNYPALDQKVVVGGSIRDAVVHYLDSPPQVEVVIEVTPAAVAPLTRLRITDAEGMLLLDLTPQSGPFELILKAGLYVLQVEVPKGQDRHQELRYIVANPPRVHITIPVHAE